MSVPEDIFTSVSSEIAADLAIKIQATSVIRFKVSY